MDKDADMQTIRNRQPMQHAASTGKGNPSELHRGLTSSAFLLSLLACSASAMDLEVGLPGLPAASYSSGAGGVTAVAACAEQVLRAARVPSG